MDSPVSDYAAFPPSSAASWPDFMAAAAQQDYLDAESGLARALQQAVDQPRAKALMADYQARRRDRARSERATAEREGRAETFAGLPESLGAEAETQWANLRMAHPPLQLGERTIRLNEPQLMGILNVTPDSFSDGGKHVDTAAATEARASAFAPLVSTRSAAAATRKAPTAMAALRRRFAAALTSTLPRSAVSARKHGSGTPSSVSSPETGSSPPQAPWTPRSSPPSAPCWSPWAWPRWPLSLLRLSTPTETQTTLALAGHERVIGLLETLLSVRGVGAGLSTVGVALLVAVAGGQLSDGGRNGSSTQEAPARGRRSANGVGLTRAANAVARPRPGAMRCTHRSDSVLR